MQKRFLKKLKRLGAAVVVASMLTVQLLPLSSVRAEGTEGPVNLALNKTVTVGGGASEVGANLITDGKIANGWENSYMYRTVAESENKESKPYVQIDLGASYNVGQIRYVGVLTPDYPRYLNTSHNMVFQVSNDPNFADESTKTVFNTDKNNYFGFGKGTDTEEASMMGGRLIEFEPMNARYVRYYQHGSSTLPTPGVNCWPNSLTACEIEVYAVAPIDTTIVGFKPITVYTAIGEAPDLPESIEAIHRDNRTAQVNVEWNEIDPSEYATKSTFTVGGVVTTDGAVWEEGVIPQATVIVGEDKPRNLVGDATATAGSFFGGDSVTYAANNAIDGNLDTAWVSVCQQGVAWGDTSLTLTWDRLITVSSFKIWSHCNPNYASDPLVANYELIGARGEILGTGTVKGLTGDKTDPGEFALSEMVSGVKSIKFTSTADGSIGGNPNDRYGFKEIVVNGIVDPKTQITSFEKVTLSTDVGTEPILPEKIMATHEDYTTSMVSIEWDDINPEDYSEVGKFSVFGTVVGGIMVAEGVRPEVKVYVNTKETVNIQAGLLNMVLNSRGQIISLLSTIDGKDYYTPGPDDKLRSLVSLVADYNIENPTSLTYDENMLIFDFDTIGVKAKVELEDNGNYTSFKLVEIINPNDVPLQTILWGPVKTSIKTGGQTVGTVYDDEYAIGMHMLNTKTIGGWPIEYKNDFYAPNLPNVNGFPDSRITRNIYSNTAAFSTWGSALQGYTWDYTKDTMRTVFYPWENPQLYPAMTGPHAEDNASMIGSSIALYGTRPDNILNVITNIQLTEGLPRPTIDGEWQKTSVATGQDFLVFNDSIWGKVDNDSRMANAAGINHIYGQYGASGPWTNQGSYQFNGHFGGSDDNVRAMVKEAAAYGVSIGVHTLSNNISYGDGNYANPATDALSYAGFSYLTRDIAAEDTTIYVKEGYPFSDAANVEGTGGKRVRIDKEILHYTGCTKVSETEWKLTGVTRGQGGTPITEHKVGDTAYKLWFYYGSLVGGWNSVDPITSRLGYIFDDIGIGSMSYDSFESTKMSIYGTILPTLYMKGVFEKGGKADGFITEASDMDTNVWDVHSRISWGESNTPINQMINYLGYYEQNFFPKMLGWSYDHGNHGGYSKPNLLMNLAMKGGWNAGTGWYVNSNTFNSYPHMAEYIKTWNNAITNGAFVVNGEYTKEIQQQMRGAWVNGKCWTLTEIEADKEWSLQEVNKSNLDMKIGDPITLYATKDIEVKQTANGDIATSTSRDYSRAHTGAEVTVYVQPFTGQQMVSGSLKVEGVDGATCELTPVSGQVGVYTFIMPEQDVTVTAQFEKTGISTEYDVTVISGTTVDTAYKAGETVTITANVPEEGKVFDKWTTADDIKFEDESSETTTFIMPAKEVTVTATYKDKPEVSIPPVTTDDAPIGWVNQDTIITLNAVAGSAEVADTYYIVDDGEQQTGNSVVLSEEGVHTIVYWSVDKEGNVEQAHTVTVSIDKTAPEIQVVVPGEGSIYEDSGDLTLQYTLADVLSGVDSSKTTVTLDGNPYELDNATPLYTLPLGQHTLIVSTTDLAGNQGSKTVSFQTVASIDSLKALVTLFANNSWIDNHGIANSLQAKLKNNNLNSFVNEVKAQSGKHISREAAEYLLRDAEYIRAQK